jgi:hypothetical protein
LNRKFTRRVAARCESLAPDSLVFDRFSRSSACLRAPLCKKIARVRRCDISVNDAKIRRAYALQMIVARRHPRVAQLQDSFISSVFLHHR